MLDRTEGRSCTTYANRTLARVLADCGRDLHDIQQVMPGGCVRRNILRVALAVWNSVTGWWKG